MREEPGPVQAASIQRRASSEGGLMISCHKLLRGGASVVVASTCRGVGPGLAGPCHSSLHRMKERCGGPWRKEEPRRCRKQAQSIAKKQWIKRKLALVVMGRGMRRGMRVSSKVPRQIKRRQGVMCTRGQTDRRTDRQTDREREIC